MKRGKIVVLSLTVLSIAGIVSAFSKSGSSSPEPKNDSVQESKEVQTINLFVTHGHCSTPFSGTVDNLKVVSEKREDQGSPLEGMRVSFEVDPESFSVCASEDLTEKIKTPGLFIGKKEEKITFKTTEVYTMGLDWYQLNGKLSIKGEERDVKFFASGIRNSKESKSTLLVLEGQFNLLDWGIDYHKIVNGESLDVPTKMMHLNMKINLN